MLTPKPTTGVENKVAMGPLNCGEPESTGESGLDSSLAIYVKGALALRVSGLVGVPVTQPVAAPPGQSVSGVLDKA